MVQISRHEQANMCRTRRVRPTDLRKTIRRSPIVAVDAPVNDQSPLQDRSAIEGAWIEVPGVHGGRHPQIQPGAAQKGEFADADPILVDQHVDPDRR